MHTQKRNIAIIGAGPMGLMTAYELLKLGNNVTIFEADDRIGGMSASFDFDGTKIERFYHFICKPDKPLFDLLSELDIHHALRWKNTKMGFFYKGKLYKWGDPISLLTFPKLNFITKMRYGKMISDIMKIKDWTKLDTIDVTTWLKSKIGIRGYETLWHSLFYYKFYQHKDNLSAAWLGTRIKRVGLSRKNLFQESLGYLDAGSDTLLNALEKEILLLGGEIKLNSPVSELISNNSAIEGIKIGDDIHKFNQVISTIPLPLLKKIATCLPHDEVEKISSIQYIGVACVLFKLKKSMSRNFWLNINDERIPIPGIIEYSNLNASDDKIVYIPYYLPHDHPKYRQNNEDFIDETITHLKQLNKNFSNEWILGAHVARYGYAQAICPPYFAQSLPSMKSKLNGLFMADTTYYYPEDRSISESIRIGKTLAKLAHANVI